MDAIDLSNGSPSAKRRRRRETEKLELAGVETEWSLKRAAPTAADYCCGVVADMMEGVRGEPEQGYADGNGDGDGEGEEFFANPNPISSKEPIPRGGPLYHPNFVGPLTTVPDFLNQLQHAMSELSFHSQPEEQDQHDPLVDDLKILQDEELMDLALTHAFQDDPHAGSVSGPSESRPAKPKNKTRYHSCRGDDESYLDKVEELVKIKQKQDQDRANVQLHSFKNKEATVQSSDVAEKSLRSTDSCKKKLKSSDIQQQVPVQHPDVVLCVEVYHHIRKSVKTQEFLVLGRQTLTEVRDKIYCISDHMMQKAGQHDPSAYFLVEDVFCIDMRDPSAIDYSEPIFDWLTNSKEDALRKWEASIGGDLKGEQREIVGEVPTLNLPQFRKVDMHSTRFCDLRFRIGAGYLYCHQGDCKHSIVIGDMRLVHPVDVQNRIAYPITVFQLKVRVQKCQICQILRATKVTVDDKWAPCNPCYFCSNCYFLLHHSHDGSLAYAGFSAYDYLHD